MEDDLIKTAILISVNEEKINLKGLEKYLKTDKDFYWPLTRFINRERFKFPINCYLHICKKQTEYKMTVKDIKEYKKGFFEKINHPGILSNGILNKFRKLDKEERKRKGVMIVSNILKLNTPIKTSSLKTRRGAFVVCAPQHYYEIQEPEN